MTYTRGMIATDQIDGATCDLCTEQYAHEYRTANGAALEDVER